MIPYPKPPLPNGLADNVGNMPGATTLQSEMWIRSVVPGLGHQKSKDVAHSWTSVVLDNFSSLQEGPLESHSAFADENDLTLALLLIASLASEPVPPEVFSKWIGGDVNKAQYLASLLSQLKQRFADASIVIDYRRDEEVAPLRVYIYGKGDPEEEAELLWKLEDELSKQGLYPLDFGVSIIDL